MTEKSALRRSQNSEERGDKKLQLNGPRLDKTSLLAGCHGRRNQEGGAGLLDAMTFRDQPWLMDATTNVAAGLEGQKGVAALTSCRGAGNWGNNEDLGSLDSEGWGQQQGWFFLIKQLKNCLTYCLYRFCMLFWERTRSKELALQSQRSGPAVRAHTRSYRQSLRVHGPREQTVGLSWKFAVMHDCRFSLHLNFTSCWTVV